MKRNYRKWWVLGLSLLFIVLTVLVYLDKVTNFDTMCYNFVAYKVSEDNILTSIYKIFTFLGSTTFIIFLAVFFFVLFLILKKKNYSYIVAASIIISTILNNVIKIIAAYPYIGHIGPNKKPLLMKLCVYISAKISSHTQPIKAYITK